MPRPELSTLRYPHLWQGCVGAWCPSQSGATGYRLFDDSGNNNHGTLTNMDPGTDWISDGKLALDFDGSNEYVNASTGFRFFQLSQDACTVSFWNKNSSGTTGVYVALSSTTNGTPFLIFQASSTSIRLANRADAGGDTSAIGGTWQSSSWRLLTGVSTPSSLTLLENGVQVATTSRTASATTLNQLSIAVLNRAGGLSNFARSQADDIRIYNRALTPSEIRLLYTGGRGAAYQLKERGRKKAYVPGYRITAPSRIQTGSARTIDGTDTESLSRGLVGAWCPSLGASGYRLIDRSGNNNHGVLTNMDPGTDWVPSDGKLALDFDGVDDLASATTKIQAGSLSISAWVFIRTLDSTTRYIAAVQNSGSDGGRMLRINSANQIQFEIIGSAIRDANGAALSTGRWIHVAGVKDAGSTGYVYQDGIQSGSVALSGVTYTAELSNFTLGRRPDSSANFLNGQLDDIRIWNRALTPNEIRLLYTGGRGVGLMPEVKPKRARIVAWDNQDKISVPARVLTNTDTLKRGLVGHWSPSVSGPQGNRLMDLSGQNNHGTLQNMDYQTDYVPSAEKGGRMALDFDGTNDYVVSNLPALQYPFSVAHWLQSSNMQNTYSINIGNEGSDLDRFIHGYVFNGTNYTANGRIWVGGQLLSFEFGNLGATFPTTFVHQVIVWRSNNNREIFVNGRSVGVNTANITQFPAVSKVFIGGYPSEGRRVRGVVDDVRIYNRALTPQEIRLLAQSRMPETATPQRTRTVFYSSGLISYLRRRSYNSILGSGVLS